MNLENFKLTCGNQRETVAIIREAAEWLVKQNMPLWDLDDLTEEKLLDGLTTENFYVGWVGEESAAAFLLQWNDPIYWPDASPHEAGIIHKFCVRRKFSGTGVSRMMMENAIEECKRRGLKYLRLDTLAERTALRNFYEGLGFEPVGEKQLGKRNFVLYQMDLNSPHLF